MKRDRITVSPIDTGKHTVHIDTSLQVQRCKAERKAKRVEDALHPYRFTSTSSYARLEFKQAWLKRLAYLYNVSQSVETSAELIGVIGERLGGHPGHKRALTTCLEAIEAFLSKSPGELTDAARLIRTRSFLRTAVLYAYRWWDSSVVHEFNGTGCVRASEPPRLRANNRIDVSTARCRRTDIRCTISGFIKRNKDSVRAIRDEIDSLGPDASQELRNASEILDSVGEDPERVCEDRVCRRLGDILVALDGIAVDSFAANNDKEWIPLANALGKALLNPVRENSSDRASG